MMMMMMMAEEACATNGENHRRRGRKSEQEYTDLYASTCIRGIDKCKSGAATTVAPLVSVLFYCFIIIIILNFLTQVSPVHDLHARLPRLQIHTRPYMAWAGRGYNR